MNRIPARKLSVEKFERLPEHPVYRLELHRGLLVREPGTSALHGYLVVRLGRRLTDHTEAHDLGVVLSNAGFVLSEEHEIVRVPDVAFVAVQRIPAEGLSERMWRLAPDLAVEVVSPSNSVSDLQEKLFDYLEYGVRMIWVVEPRTRSVVLWSNEGSVQVLRGAATLDGGLILPGFSLSLSELFRV